MFYFSKGKLNEILDKNSLFYALNRSFENIVIRSSVQKPILKVVDLITINITENTLTDFNQSIFIITLFDGFNYIPAIIDSKKEHFIFNFENFLKNTDFKNDENNFLQIGTVFILSSYSFISLIDLSLKCLDLNNLDIDQKSELLLSSSINKLENNEIQLNDNIYIENFKRKLKNSKFFSIDEYNYNFFLKLNDFLLIGFENVICDQSQLNDICSFQNNKDKNDDINIEITHSINQINIQMSNSFWSIRVFVAERTPCKEFQNRKNGQSGKIMRLKLLSCDPANINNLETCFKIEAVLFNGLCESEQIKSIKLKTYYFISNGTIKFAKGTCLAWPNCVLDKFENTINSKYDIYFTNETLMVQLDESNYTHQFEIKENNEISKSQIDKENQPLKKIENNYTLHQNQLCKLNSKFTPLNQLKSIKPKTLIDIMAIIENIEQLKSISKKPYEKTCYSGSNKPLSIRNIKVIDQTNVLVSVALWGKQAEEFSFRPGCCILFNDVEVSNYMGRSLSVIRKSGFLEMPNDLPVVIELKEWYKNKKLNNFVK